MKLPQTPPIFNLQANQEYRLTVPCGREQHTLQSDLNQIGIFEHLSLRLCNAHKGNLLEDQINKDDNTIPIKIRKYFVKMDKGLSNSDLPKNQICTCVRFVDFYWDLKTLIEDMFTLHFETNKEHYCSIWGTNPHV